MALNVALAITCSGWDTEEEYVIYCTAKSIVKNYAKAQMRQLVEATKNGLGKS